MGIINLFNQSQPRMNKLKILVEFCKSPTIPAVQFESIRIWKLHTGKSRMLLPTGEWDV